ncbi:hypothetical protein RUM43_006466 [Polyplax serrata]|uniref:Uncharacterized protein n=1 Tax=Polyplax serrata TaxID=468196 RepID=A0AAN8PLF1_POLSC
MENEKLGGLRMEKEKWEAKDGKRKGGYENKKGDKDKDEDNLGESRIEDKMAEYQLIKFKNK